MSAARRAGTRIIAPRREETEDEDPDALKVFSNFMLYRTRLNSEEDTWVGVRTPKGALNEGLRAALVDQRDALLAAVSSYPCATCGRFSFQSPSTVCFWCRARAATPSAEGRSDA